MSKVYDGNELRRTCLIRGREGEGRFGLICKRVNISKVIRRGTKGEGEDVETSSVYDERIAPPVRRLAAGRNPLQSASPQPPRSVPQQPRSVPPRPLLAPQPQPPRPVLPVSQPVRPPRPGPFVPRRVGSPPNGFWLAGRVMCLGMLTHQFAELERVIDEYLGFYSDKGIDPARKALVDPAMARIAIKVIEWLQAILDGEIPRIPLTEPGCTIAHPAFLADISKALRQLFATELKRVVPPEDFRAIQARAIEVVDEPWSPDERDED